MEKFNNLFPMQVYINLDSRPDRNSQFKNEISKTSFHPFRMSGFVPNDIENKWWKGTIGCLSSHISILQSALSMRTNVFIFEDDVLFINNDEIESTIEHAAQELSEIDWNFLYLGANILKPFYQITPNLAKLNHCQSTVAYGVNYSFIPKIFKYIDFNKIDRPIDVYYSDMASNNNFYITVPMLAIQRDSFSDIEGQNVNYSSYLEKRYNDNLIRS